MSTDDINNSSTNIEFLLDEVERLRVLGVQEDMVSRVLSIAVTYGRSVTDVVTDVDANARICNEEGLETHPLISHTSMADPRIAISVTGIMYAAHTNSKGVKAICQRVKEWALRAEVPQYMAADILYLASRARPDGGR